MKYVHVMLVAAALAIPACGRKSQPAVVASPPSAVAETPPAPPPVTALPSVPAPPGAPPTDEELFARKSLEELNAERPLRDIFFDFDDASLRAPELVALQANAEWLKRWAGTRITIEGHCDSRGTPEYNLALGERRSTAAKQYLIGLGVAPDRIGAISKGKEQPFCDGEDEPCWQQNRRGHFIITAK